MKKSVKIVVLGATLAIAFFGIVNHSYAAKPSDYGLKEGDLISAIFSDDPDVYIINNDGYKRLFLNPAIFNMYSHLGGFFNVKLVPVEVRDAFATSGLFRNCETNDPKVYGVDIDGEDTGSLHWVNVSAENAVSEDHEFFKKVFCINGIEFKWYPKGNEFKKVKDVPNYERMKEKSKISTEEKIKEKYEMKNIGKTVICHYPLGNPGTHNTLTIATSALKAHLEHGDTVGVCSDESLSTTDKTAPIITGATATNITYNSASISWNTNELSDSLVRYGLTTSYTTYTPTDSSLVTSHVIILTGLSPNTTYYYQAKSRDAASNLAVSEAYTFKTTVAPEGITLTTTPTELVATTISSSKIGLTWTAPTNFPDLVGYKVYKGGVIVAAVATTSYTDSGLTGLTSYTYNVAAYNTAHSFSDKSNSATATTLTSASGDIIAPSVPTNLVATPIYWYKIGLTWTASTDNVGVVGYNVYRNGVLVETPSGTSYHDMDLTASTSYSYTVAAYDAAGNISAQTSAVSATTPAAPDTAAPSVPGDLTATAVSASQINLAWTASTDNVRLSGYKIYRGEALTLIGATDINSYSDMGLTASTSYTYKVAAYDTSSNFSAQSNSATATTLAP
jgi:chitodextrinase